MIQSCMCKNCGIYPADDLTPITHFRQNVIPTFRKHDKWMQNEINERDYCWFTMGQFINMQPNEENVKFWDWALRFKEDDINDTILNILKDAQLAINMESQQSPLN